MHSMTDHKTVEEVIRHGVSWEDSDSLLIVGLEEDGSIVVAQNWQWKFEKGSTFLEALYKSISTCYCDEEEDVEDESLEDL